MTIFRIFVIGAALTVAGCAFTSNALPGPVAEAASNSSLNYVEQVDVRSLPTRDELACEMRAPTGSRIAVETCRAVDAGSDDEIAAATRDDLRTLREQQMYMNQARLNALREMASRRAGGGRN